MILRKSVSAFALDVVGHVLAQPGAGPVQQPEPAEGVFDEVADDPVRGEELGDGGDVLRGHGALAGHDRVLFLRDVELVEPAEDLDLGAILVGDLGAEAWATECSVSRSSGKQQFGLVVQPLEEVGQQRVVEAARGQHEVAIDLALRIMPTECGHRAGH